MKRVYERFCSRHNEAVNFYKDLMTKDKRFKAFIKVRQKRHQLLISFRFHVMFCRIVEATRTQ